MDYILLCVVVNSKIQGITFTIDLYPSNTLLLLFYLFPDDHQLFHHFLKKINANLSYVQFELRAFRNQYDGTIYYGVVNNIADEQSKLGTKYTVPQIAFYKGIVSVGAPLWLCINLNFGS